MKKLVDIFHIYNNNDNDNYNKFVIYFIGIKNLSKYFLIHVLNYVCLKNS